MKTIEVKFKKVKGVNLIGREVLWETDAFDYIFLQSIALAPKIGLPISFQEIFRMFMKDYVEMVNEGLHKKAMQHLKSKKDLTKYASEKGYYIELREDDCEFTSEASA